MMKVQFSFVGEAALVRREAGEGDLFVEMDAVPREGDVINAPGISQGHTVVRTVVWYPLGDDPEKEGWAPSPNDRSEPFVYVVVGNPRPH